MQSIVMDQIGNRESEIDNIQFHSKPSHHQSVVVMGNHSRSIVDPIGPQRTKLQVQANKKDNTHDDELLSDTEFAHIDEKEAENNDVASASTLGSERNKKVSDIF